MKGRQFFWIPALIWLALIWLATGITAYFLGTAIALIAGMLLSSVAILFHLFNLNLLDNWLVEGRKQRLPRYMGSWGKVYSDFNELSQKESETQQKLEDMLSRFQQAMSYLPDGVVITNDRYQLEWFNPMAENLLNLNLDRDKGILMTRLINSPPFTDYIIQGQFTQPIEITLQQYTLSLRIVPVDRLHRLLVIHNLTESIKTEKMRRDFIANASHELRTPLTVINGFLEIALSQPDLDKETRLSHLSMMKEQGERMQVLVQDMLALTNLESSDNKPIREPFNIIELIQQLHRNSQALSSGRHTITLDISGPQTVFGNRDEIGTAFSNIITNAIRYTPEGGTIDIFWKQNEAEPVFAVRDTGIGIAPEHIPLLTQRFYRVDKSRSRQVNGTGLGLSIVRHILIRHDAQLHIQSTPGKGSEFSIQFNQDFLRP